MWRPVQGPIYFFVYIFKVTSKIWMKSTENFTLLVVYSKLKWNDQRET